MRHRLMSKIARLVGLGAMLALGLTGVATLNARAPAPATDWTKTVVVTSQGGYRMGNPAAKYKLVEYGSRTCPTCKAFDDSGRTGVLERVRSGTMSYEFRDYPVHGALDLAPILLGRCVPPSQYFPFLFAMFDMQDEAWKKFRAIPKADLDKLGKDPVKTANALGVRMGYVALGAKFGLTPARATACLSNQKALDALSARAKAAGAAGIDSTPSFILNGQALSAVLWDGIAAVLNYYDKQKK